MPTIAPSILARYVEDIAFAAGAPVAETPQEFVAQLETAARNLEVAGINGAEDLETAATYLTDAIASTGQDRRVLLKTAIDYLTDAADMVDEYRDMV